MEHAALLVLGWLGKIIAGRLAGSAAAEAWVRLRPTFERLLRSGLLWKETADQHKQATDEHEQAAARVEDATKDVPNLLEEAVNRITALEQQNAQLKQQLSKHEQAGPPAD